MTDNSQGLPPDAELAYRHARVRASFPRTPSRRSRWLRSGRRHPTS